MEQQQACRQDDSDYISIETWIERTSQATSRSTRRKQKQLQFPTVTAAARKLSGRVLHERNMNQVSRRGNKAKRGKSATNANANAALEAITPKKVDVNIEYLDDLTPPA